MSRYTIADRSSSSPSASNEATVAANCKAAAADVDNGEESDRARIVSVITSSRGCSEDAAIRPSVCRPLKKRAPKGLRQRGKPPVIRSASRLQS